MAPLDQHLSHDQSLNQESIFIPIHSGEQLYLKRIYTNRNDPPVFLLHGLMSNGKIFYTESGKGLAPYLARNGFDVFIPDLRGVGRSVPALDRHSTHGQTEAILEEIPLFIKQIIRIKGDEPQHWMAHSWGGALLIGCYARFPDFEQRVKSFTFLASRRHVKSSGLKKFFVFNFVLYTFSDWVCRLYGYWAVKKLGLGQENGTRKSYQQAMNWFRSADWKDSDDNFDYGQALKNLSLPRVQSFSGSLDQAPGHPDDIARFLKEIGVPDIRNIVVGKKQGFTTDYDHITLLTNPRASKDHFPLIVKGLKS